MVEAGFAAGEFGVEDFGEVEPELLADPVEERGAIILLCVFGAEGRSPREEVGVSESSERAGRGVAGQVQEVLIPEAEERRDESPL